MGCPKIGGTTTQNVTVGFGWVYSKNVWVVLKTKFLTTNRSLPAYGVNYPIAILWGCQTWQLVFSHCPE